MLQAAAAVPRWHACTISLLCAQHLAAGFAKDLCGCCPSCCPRFQKLGTERAARRVRGVVGFRCRRCFRIALRPRHTAAVAHSPSAGCPRASPGAASLVPQPLPWIPGLDWADARRVVEGEAAAAVVVPVAFLLWGASASRAVAASVAAPAYRAAEPACQAAAAFRAAAAFQAAAACVAVVIACRVAAAACRVADACRVGAAAC